MVSLAKPKLNSLNVLISKAVIDLNITHDKYFKKKNTKTDMMI